MSLEHTKENLIRYLADADNKVIALSGKWGTGKSHLWREVKAASPDDAVKGALYVSLFGLSDMGQIKLKIVQNALPNSEKSSVMWDKARVGAEAARKLLTSIHKGFSALDELALLAVPSILKNRVIVLDDIERKHDKLNIDEVLGFIDEFTQQHGARFILILNSDQLANKALWETLREKVVDQEIQLNTSPNEAFAIAIGLTPSKFSAAISDAVKKCEITNIRIIRKITKAVNSILGDRHALPAAILSRTVPSIVLLASINYRGLENGPTVDFVLARGTPSDWKYSEGEDETETETETDSSRNESKWGLMLDELGIQVCDEFELLVIEYLQSGMFNVSALDAIIDRYVAETESLEAREKAIELSISLFWDHKVTEGEHLAQAQALLPVVHLVDPYIVSKLALEVAALPDGPKVAQSMLGNWLAALRAKQLTQIDDDNPFGKTLHPSIQAEFDAINSQVHASTTLYDAVEHIKNNSGWGARHERALRSASVAEFESVIRSLPRDQLRVFMQKMLELRAQKATYDQHFAPALDHFTEACRNLRNAPNSGRLGELLQRLFDHAKLGAQLAPISPVP